MFFPWPLGSVRATFHLIGPIIGKKNTNWPVIKNTKADLQKAGWHFFLCLVGMCVQSFTAIGE